mmetsp:Transcript_60053/g.118077  ORF Transcript_60053/g.118077 Transcript_60053/m.118077 type:complete len:215 (+) Transcript_60053:620-1264(+)
MKSIGSSSASKVGFKNRYPSSRRVTSTSPSMSGSQLSLYFVVLGLPSRFRRPERLATSSPFFSMPSTTALPQCISVTSSPWVSTWASSCLKYTVLATSISFVPMSGFLGCKFSAFAVGLAGAPDKVSLTMRCFSRAQYLGMIGSIFCLLMAQILSHDMEFVFLDAPCVMTNSFNASTVSPRRRTPRRVGIRGSSHPVTVPWSTSFVSFRLDSTV